jgi:glycosyltransferase involved in cell wall biosynthesis
MSLSVSVLPCTRNRPAKLHSAVDSILVNLYRDFELVIVDQSTDEASRAKVESFVDPRIVYIQTDTVGLSQARNIAIRVARSSIIVFTDVETPAVHSEMPSTQEGRSLAQAWTNDGVMRSRRG